MQRFALPLAALSFAATVPFAAHAQSASVAFKAPTSNRTVSGTLASGACEVGGSNIYRVKFYLDAQEIGTDSSAPWNCTLDTRRYSNGTHTLRAVAFNSAGSATSAQVAINIQNGTTSPTPGSTSTSSPAGTASGSPTVSFRKPTSGAVLSGSLSQSSACEAVGSNIYRVKFYLDRQELNTENGAPWNCNLDTTRFSNGSHTLMAVAYSASGASSTAQVPISIQNGAAAPAPAPSAPAPAPTTTPSSPLGEPAGALSSSGARAVATFHSIGLYWTPGANPGSAGCQVRFRKSGDSAWRAGLALWYDGRNGECRGSLVHLDPGTSYEVQLGLPGQSWSRQVAARTWSESFPIARTVTLPNGTIPSLSITEGGTANGYVLYTAPPGGQTTIDGGNARQYNITVSAPYVIIRGLTLKGAKQDAIRLLPGARDVVIEGNDISGWGRLNYTNSAGWKIGVDMDSGVRAVCSSSFQLERVVIQNNRIHHPRYGANSWSWGHPAGPQAITFSHCGGNHVMRYNQIDSQEGQYFNDAIGGEDNFTAVGFPNADTDIYGNRISHAWDDGIEAEGGNRNVRIWGNYLDRTGIAIASTVVHHGPLYIFRNVYNRSRSHSERALDADDRNAFAKAGSSSSYGNGRRYLFHNTLLQATGAGAQYPLGAGTGLKGNTGQPLTNTVSRNNIFHIWKPHWAAIAELGGSGNDLDFDLFNGNISAYAGAERNGIVGTPIYQSGHGWQSEANGNYQLAPSSPGYDRGARIPNFSDGFTGAAPDIGAHEAGTPPMRFGRR